MCVCVCVCVCVCSQGCWPGLDRCCRVFTNHVTKLHNHLAYFLHLALPVLGDMFNCDAMPPIYANMSLSCSVTVYALIVRF